MSLRFKQGELALYAFQIATHRLDEQAPVPGEVCEVLEVGPYKRGTFHTRYGLIKHDCDYLIGNSQHPHLRSVRDIQLVKLGDPDPTEAVETTEEIEA